MSVINTNISATIAQNSLVKTNRDMQTAMQQLSTGSRINAAKDDAAGLAISSKMTSQINGLNQAVRNANDGISLVQTAEGALVEVTNMMQRMRELAVQSANDTNTESDREAMDLEFQQLKAEINRVAENTQFNGTNLLDGTFNENGTNGKFFFQVGANSDQTIDITISNFTTTAGGGAGGGVSQQSILALSGALAAEDTIEISLDGGTTSRTYAVVLDDLGADDAETQANIISKLTKLDFEGFSLSGSGAVLTIVEDGSASFDMQVTVTAAGDGAGVAVNTVEAVAGAGAASDLSMIDSDEITSKASADASIDNLDLALGFVNEARAEMGATINRLTFAADNLMNVSQNASESRSRILDTDFAATTTELARTQIIAQAGTAMLAQANQQPQSVLALLQ